MLFNWCEFGLFQLYEEEKSEKERLKRDLEYCKKELREAKLELDRQMKRSDANRVSETNDKRVRNSLPVSLILYSYRNFFKSASLFSRVITTDIHILC